MAVDVGGGRITNALFTTRDIEAGEELSWDYACVTESEPEFRAAICLCASPQLPRILLVLLQLLYLPDGMAHSELLSLMQTCTAPANAGHGSTLDALTLQPECLPSITKSIFPVTCTGEAARCTVLGPQQAQRILNCLQVMQKQHDVLDRNAVLVRACTQPLTASDQEGLSHHGIGSSLLGSTPPPWLVKWAALILQFIEVKP